MCPVCQEKRRERSRKRWQNLTPEQKAAASAYHKNWYENRKAQGICVSCGKNPAKENHTKCEGCLAKDRKRKERTE